MTTAEVKCSQCGQDMHSSGFHGVCARCLFSLANAGRGEAGGEGSPTDELKPGSVVGAHGRFLLLEIIGVGGMGEVWLANDRELSQENEPHLVALKFLPADIRHHRRALDLLRQEVTRAQSLVHPNIVRVHDLHTSASGMPFIKMEYLEGNSLALWLRQYGVMPWRMVNELGLQLASALAYAHETARMVHRDIKPSNLLLTKGPTLKLTDFGISQALQDVSTSSGDFVGTLAYASPQQVGRMAPQLADDIYSVGATLYELLTGTTPHKAASTKELIDRIQYEAAEPVAERLNYMGITGGLPTKLALLIDRCLHKQPAHRPLARELAGLFPPPAGSPLPLKTGRLQSIPAIPESEWSEPEVAAPKARWPGVLLALLILAAAGAGAWQFRDRLGFGPGLGSNPPSVGATEAAREADQEPGETGPATIPAVGTTAASAAPVASAVPAVPEGKGTLKIFIKPLDPYAAHKIRLSNGRTNYAFSMKPRQTQHLLPGLAAGAWDVEANDPSYGDSWVKLSKVVEPDRTNEVRLVFEDADVTLHSDPKGAAVSWDLQKKGWGDSGITTLSRQKFLSGVDIPILFRKAGFRDLRTNLHPTPNLRFGVTLQPAEQPVFDDFRTPDWTNSLKMPFRWVDNRYVAVVETTVAAFQAFAEANPDFVASDMYKMTTPAGRKQGGWTWKNPDFPQTTNHPVVGVTLRDAVRFCEWLTKAERGQGKITANQRYRLPTKEEWLRLAGGARYPWGEKVPITGKLPGNFSGREVRGGSGLAWPESFPLLENYSDKHPRTAPVDSLDYPTNALGLLHLGGNVAEWVEEGLNCGGSWFDGENLPDLDTLATSALTRAQPAPTEADERVGFRVTLEDSSHP